MSLVVAQSASIATLWVWVLALIGVVVVGAFVMLTVRRRLLHDDSSGHDPNAGLFERLDAMRRDGEISDEEYAQTRRAMIEKHRAGLREKR